MHPERFGRALGVGFREAGRAALRAADAAQSPSPARPVSAPAVQERPVPRRGSLQGGVRGFASNAAKPVLRAGGVLWLEVTGFLFLLIALVAAGGVWAGRAHLRRGPGQAHELAGVLMLAVFLWFGVSNFLRARRRAQRP